MVNTPTPKPSKGGLKKSSTKLSPEDRDRITAVSLEHPQLGVRKLVDLLSEEGIKISESALRSALRAQSLHTRDLRLKFLEEQHLGEGRTLSDLQQRALYDFNPCLREQLLQCDLPGLLLIQDAVDLGKLKNIDQTLLHIAIDPCCCLAFAALSGPAEQMAAIAVLKGQALVFYHKAGVALQTVVAGKGMVSAHGVDNQYLNFLKSNGIALKLPPADDQPKNGFVERFERLVRKDFLPSVRGPQEFQDLEAIQSAFNGWLEQFNHETRLPGFPIMGRTPLEAFQAAAAQPARLEESGDQPAPEPEPERASPPSAAASVPPPAVRPLLKHRERTAGSGAWGFRAINAALACLVIYLGWQVTSKVIEYRQPVEDLGPPASVQPAPILSDPQERTPSIQEYQVIAARNLFGGSSPSPAAANRERIDVDKIAVAGRDVGLKLIGTAVSSEPQLSFAIIDVAGTREPRIFREKDRVGKAVIKLILRNNVIIEAEDGRRQRLTIDDEGLKNPRAEKEMAAKLEVQDAGPRPAEIEKIDVVYKIPHDQVASSLSDIRQAMNESNISPHTIGGKTEGFFVKSLGSQNILARIGLRPGDVIMGIDDQEFEGAAQAETLFQRLAHGGDFSILVLRRGRLQKMNFLVE
jgi:general secretion pathway protein C